MRSAHLALVLAAVSALTLTIYAQTPAPAQATPAAAAFTEGIRLHDGGKPADAIPFFKDAIAKGFQPINQAHFRLARAYAKAGDAESALKELEFQTADMRVMGVYPAHPYREDMP